MITLSAKFGFGQNLSDIPLNDVAPGILYEVIGQTVLVVGTIVTKASLAIFLLRLVSGRGHKLAILIPLGFLAAAVVVSLLVFWFSCTPTRYLWDRTIKGGHCTIDPGPIATIAGAASVILDFWYAGFPWYMLWPLQMPPREKLLIGCSLGLGVVYVPDHPFTALRMVLS